MENNHNPMEDDGSLDFLKIPALVKIKMNRDDHDRDARKFFTNSREIKYVLAKIREMDKFPRRVTMRASGTRYYLE